MLIFCRSSIYSLIFPYKKNQWMVVDPAVHGRAVPLWGSLTSYPPGLCRRLATNHRVWARRRSKGEQKCQAPVCHRPLGIRKDWGINVNYIMNKKLWQAYHGISSIHEVLMHFLDTSTVDRIDGYYSHWICTLSLYLLGIIYKRSSKPRKFLHYSLVM
jgi:hypothetical protein